jgi:hypothetical protein
VDNATERSIFLEDCDYESCCFSDTEEAKKREICTGGQISVQNYNKTHCA